MSSETVQTVQDQKPRDPWFEVSQDDGGKWHWCLWSGNGRQMAHSAVPYDRRKNAIEAIRLMVAACEVAKVIASANE